MLFQTTKIQTFESNSQRIRHRSSESGGCFRLQRYKFLKAIHNSASRTVELMSVVSDYKDTNFESNSQQLARLADALGRCFRLQRYKFLKAIHNTMSDEVKVFLFFQIIILIFVFQFKL